MNWKAGVEFDAGPRSLLYANVSTGFKAGGFYYGPPGAQTYEPESVTSYVAGSKNRFLGNTLQINAEAFYLDYQKQQISFVKLIGVSSTLVTENAGKSHAYGFEIEGNFLATKTTQLGLQAQYLKAKYDSFSYLSPGALPASSQCRTSPSGSQFLINCDGVIPLRAPTWTIIGNLEQRLPLADGSDIIGDASLRYETEFQSDVSYIPETLGYATARLDLGLSYVAPGDRFTLKAFVNNVTNVVTITSATMNNSYAVNQIVGVNLLPPRTYGLRGSFKF